MQSVMMILLGGISSSACSSEEGARNYTVPDSLCGIGVESQLIASLLPPGDSLSEFDGIRRNSDGTTGVHGACALEVDGKDALFLETDGSEEASTIESFLAESYKSLSKEEAKPVQGSAYKALEWPTAVVLFTPCEKSDFDYASLSLVVEVEWTDDEDLSESLVALAESYFQDRLTEIEPQACRS